MSLDDYAANRVASLQDLARIHCDARLPAVTCDGEKHLVYVSPGDWRSRAPTTTRIWRGWRKMHASSSTCSIPAVSRSQGRRHQQHESVTRHCVEEQPWQPQQAWRSWQHRR
jgi:hypothetical protein